MDATEPEDGLVVGETEMSYDAARRYPVTVSSPDGPVLSRASEHCTETRAVVEALHGLETRIQIDITAPTRRGRPSSRLGAVSPGRPECNHGGLLLGWT